jgi:hypothetical protein
VTDRAGVASLGGQSYQFRGGECRCLVFSELHQATFTVLKLFWPHPSATLLLDQAIHIPGRLLSMAVSRQENRAVPIFGSLMMYLQVRVPDDDERSAFPQNQRELTCRAHAVYFRESHGQGLAQDGEQALRMVPKPTGTDRLTNIPPAVSHRSLRRSRSGVNWSWGSGLS